MIDGSSEIEGHWISAVVSGYSIWLSRSRVGTAEHPARVINLIDITKTNLYVGVRHNSYKQCENHKILLVNFDFRVQNASFSDDFWWCFLYAKIKVH